jgi:hypothetical protein
MTRFLSAVVLVLLGGVAAAQSPNVDDHLRPGANHHLGDDAFRKKFGRAPTEADEALRMHTHFEAVRDLLRARPATRPDLEDKRARILALFDAYIAKGTTPKNEHLPWRTPVFIDDAGTICAVGYLIEQTAGRPVAEKIAAEHRYSYLEEIAAAMPEVRDWVAASGLTLEELSLIQPGYEGPEIDHVVAWNPKKDKVPDGAYDQAGIHGTLAHGEMVGDWTRTDDAGHVVGQGQFAHGAAKWTSFYPDGKRLAEGAFANSQPTGTWKIYHPSGNLAAEGRLRRGARDGQWRFYYDTPAKTLIAAGAFAHADLTGTWQHFDDTGHLLATERPSQEGWLEREGVLGLFQLDIVAGKDGVRHRVHEGNVAADSTRLDELISADGEEKLYVRDLGQVFDQHGFAIAEHAGVLTSADCRWSAARKHAASQGQLSRLHELVWRDAFNSDEEANDCSKPEPIAPKRAAKLQAMLASMHAVRAQTPDFVRALALGDVTVDDAAAPADPAATAPADGKAELQEAMTSRDDLAKILASNMVWYVEWPHVDGMFVKLYATVAGMRDSRQ